MLQKAGTTRTRRSEDEWRALIAQQADSGLSQQAFCKERGVPLASFSNARQRYYAAPAKSVSEFVPVDVNESNTWEIKLALGEGMTLRLRRT